MLAIVLAGCSATQAPSFSAEAAPAQPVTPTASSAATSTDVRSPSPAVATPAGPGQIASPSPRPEVQTMAPFALTSTAFAEGGAIPRRYTCDAQDVSPPLAWSGAPGGTVSFAIIVDDPDARGWVHWVAYDIPESTTALAAGAAGPFRVGLTSWGPAGWRGPCPPSGTHRYVFRLWALDAELGLGGTPTADQVRAAIESRSLGTTTLTGTYRRG